MPNKQAFLEYVASIQSYRQSDLNEAMTRHYVVAPLLRILGYSSPAELGLEVRVPNTGDFIDYQLIVDGRPRAIVEAKPLRNEITDKHASQCVSYAVDLGVQWCLVTNGIVWRIYDAYRAKKPLEQKLVVEVRLDDNPDTNDDAWKVLSQFSRGSLAAKEPLEDLFVENVVRTELQDPTSGAVNALRRSLRTRMDTRITAEAVVAALARIIEPQQRPPRGVRERGDATKPPLRAEKANGRFTLSKLVDAGLVPADATLDMRWRGKVYQGRLVNGSIAIDGRTFETPSAAGSFILGGGACDGWRYWSFHGETLGAIREKHLAQTLTRSGPAIT